MPNQRMHSDGGSLRDLRKRSRRSLARTFPCRLRFWQWRKYKAGQNRHVEKLSYFFIWTCAIWFQVIDNDR